MELFVFKLEQSSKNALEIYYAWEEAAKELRENFDFIPTRTMETRLQSIEFGFKNTMKVLVSDHDIVQEVVDFRVYSQSQLGRRGNR